MTRGEILSAQRALEEGRPHTYVKPFGPEWASFYWTKWARIAEAMKQLEVLPPATVLDAGCGSGWTSVFLAEAGYDVTGFDIAPAQLKIAQMRAERWGVPLRLELADMDDLDLGHRRFEFALVFDALHHTERRRQVIAGVARHLLPGGWVLFGEPSWLHYVSPRARRFRKLDWVERGVTARGLRRDCRAAGLGEFRRFFEGTGPYHGRVRGFGWQLLRLCFGNFLVAPQVSIWLAARKPLRR